MHEALKEAVGIETASCASCRHLGSDGDGDEVNYRSWPVCDKVPRFNNLLSFPFRKEMTCWRPNFWHSKFADEITDSDGGVSALDDSVNLATQKFLEACKNEP